MSSLIKKYLKGVFFSKIREYKIPENIDEKWTSINVKVKNQTIATRLWKNKSKVASCVFLIHPYHKDAKDYFLYSGHPELYHEMGLHVVIFDFNGFGESSNSGFDFDKDILTIVNYYKKVINSKFNIGHGISFGAAMLLKSLSNEPCFDRAIIENCLDETPNYFKRRSYSLYIFIEILFTLLPDWRKSNQYFHIIKRVKDINSLCFIYNEEDDLTTPTMGRKLAENCQIPYDYHLLKGKHMQSIKADSLKYKEIIKTYLADSKLSHAKINR